uniref:Mating type MTLa2 n=1 Tax=Candidozyma auris TaxID=498019 RepID=A0A544W902_CANAR|nr:mating type MTLa2 [[Candida] auris]
MIYSTTSRLPAKSKGPLSKRTRCRHFPYSELKLLHTSTEATDKSKRYRPRNQFMMARQHLTSTFKDGRCARVKSIRASQVCSLSCRFSSGLLRNTVRTKFNCTVSMQYSSIASCELSLQGCQISGAVETAGSKKRKIFLWLTGGRCGTFSSMQILRKG